jgi:choice-of-anchor A domain-containing protein
LEGLDGREVPATGLGVANDFSAFILHDLNAYQSDVQGRLAVGGNASLTAYAVGDKLLDSDGTRDDLIVGGNLNFTNGQVFFGNVVHGGTGTFGSFGHPNGTIRQGTVINFAAAETELETLSDGYAALAPNGTVQDSWGTIILTGTQAGQNVFNVPAAMLWDAYDLQIHAPAGSSAIVNITGAAARMQFMGFHLNGVAQENVILNFPQATELTFQGIGINANILAPRAAVEFSNGQINGSLVADSWSGFGQVNLTEIPPLPPPPAQPPECPVPLSQISGLVYHDQNEDGVAQDTEPRLSGVAITLTGQDLDGNTVTRSATTDGGGIYIFDQFPAGVYSIAAATPDGYMPGQSSTGVFGGVTQPNLISTIDIPAGQGSGGYNFGEVLCDPPPPPPPPPECPTCEGQSKVSGLVYFDKEQDGVAQDYDWRLEGVLITLTGQDEDGNAVNRQTTTDAGGIYEFAGLAAGTYTITVLTPDGYTPGESSPGAFGGQADGNSIAGIVIGDCESSGGYNFGQFKDEGPRPR